MVQDRGVIKLVKKKGGGNNVEGDWECHVSGCGWKKTGSRSMANLHARKEHADAVPRVITSGGATPRCVHVLSTT
jgi:hypothetical protein